MIKQFVKDLLQQKGLPPNLDEAVYNRLVSDLAGRAADLVNKRLVEAMSEDQVKELEKIITSDPADQEAVQNFIAKNVPDSQAVAGAALAEFRQLYLGNSG